MHFDDLTAEEQSVLTGLVRLVVRIDGAFSPEEVHAVAGLAKELGAPGFWSTMVESQTFTMDDLADRVSAVTRPEVQDYIYGIVVGLAAVDGIHVAETELLDWVAKSWSMG